MLEQLGPLAYGFALLLFRTLGLVTSAPLLSLKGAPQTLRLGLAAATTFAIFTGAGAPQATLPPHLGVLVAQVFAETALGVVTGLTITFALEAAGAAGQLASQSMGLGYAAVLDPLGGNESTIVGQLLKLAALGAALAMGLHREIVLWLASSVHTVPPGAVENLKDLAQGVALQAVHGVGLSVRLGFPFLAAITLGHLTMGLLGKAAPQLHLQNIGFAVSIVVGGGALYLFTPQLLALAAQAAVGSVGR